MKKLAKKKWLWITALFAVINIVGWVAIHQRLAEPDPELQARITPTTDALREFDFPKIQFSEPMIALNEIGSPVNPDMVEMTPAVGGKFVWDSETSCAWESDMPLRFATRYKVSVNPDMRSRAGRMIGSDLERTWETPRPAVESVCQTNLDSRGRLTVGLDFSTAIPLESLKKSLTITTAEGKKLDFTVKSTHAEGQTYLVRTEPLPEIGKVKVVVAEGLRATAGNLVSQKATRHEINVESDLRIHSFDCSTDGESLYLYFYANSSIDINHAADFIRIEPEVKITASRRWGGIRLDGDFEPDTSYAVTFLRGFPATNGTKLKASTVRRLQTPDFRPSLSIGCEGVYMAAGVERPILPLRTMNVDQVNLTIQRVFENNILLCLRDKRVEMPDDMGPKASTTKIDTTNPKNQSRTTSIDLAQVLKQRPQGVYFVKAASAANRWRDDIKLVMVTNLGITVHRTGKSALVWVNALDTAAPVANAAVTIYSKTNQRLGKGLTDVNGIVRFDDLPEDREPYAVTAAHDKDLAFLPFDRGAMRLQDLKLSGRPYLREGYEAFMFSERGVYRPGEEVFLHTIVRANGMELPGTIPLVVKVRRPDGRLFHESSVRLSTSGNAGVRLSLPTHARTGRYKASIMLPKAKGSLGEVSFQVEEFMPDRMKVRIDTEKGTYGIPGKEMAVAVCGEHYFGAPAAGRRVKLRGRYVPVPFSSKEFPDYTFGRTGDTPATTTKDLGDSRLDANGKAPFKIKIPKTLTKTGSAELVLTATLKELGGRAVTAATTVPVQTCPLQIGVRKVGGKWCQVGQQAEFSLVVLAPAGTLRVAPVDLQVKCSEVSWNTVVREDENGRWRYISERQEVPTHTTQARIDKGKGSFSWTPKRTGTYLIRVRDPESGTVTEAEVVCGGNGYVHWDMRKADRLQLTSDKKMYRPGETAKVRIQSPFSGQLLLTLESDRLHAVKVIEMTGNTTEVEFPVESTWAPNLFCTATVIRPPKRAALVGIQRAFGAVPLRLDFSAKKLQVAVSAPKVTRPDVPFTVRIKVSDHAGQPAPAEVFLAAVDEGVLSLTAHKTPTPWRWFTKDRGLATSVNDVYGLVMPDYDRHLIGRDSVAGGGGTVAAMARLLNPIAAKRVRVISLVHEKIETDASGEAIVSLTVPEFEGELRIMAIVSGPAGIGSANETMTVRSPLMIRPTLPRFLAPHDEVEVPISVFNRTGNDGSVDIEIDGKHIEFPGQRKAAVTVRDGNEGRMVFKLRAPAVPGKATVLIKAKLGKETVTRRIELPVRPPESLQYISGTGTVAGGKTATLDIAGTFVKGTGEYAIAFSNRPDLKLSDSLRYLIQYPYGCLEQTTSRTFPMLCLAPLVKQNLPKAGKPANIDRYVNSGINRVLSMQLTNGGFGLWPSDTSPYRWGSVYATHMLVEAKKAGHAVPADSLAKALDYLGELLRRSKAKRETKAYACHVLAVAGRPNRSWTMRLYEERKSLPVYSQFQIARALWQLRERKTATSLVQLTQLPMVDQPPELGGVLNSPVRRDAILLSALVDVNPDAPLVHDLARRLSRALEPGRYYSTQSNSFALLALGSYMNKHNPDEAGYIAHIERGGKLLRTITGSDTAKLNIAGPGPVTVKVEGKGKVYFHWSGEGVPSTAAPETDAGLRVRRRLFTREGTPLKQGKLKQGDLVVVELSLFSDRNLKNIAVNDLLPAAFEIENPNLQTREAMPWLRKESLRPQRVDRRDDRFLMFTDLNRNGWRRYRYAARVVSAGSFVMPPVHAFCMYDQSISSRHGRGQVEVVQ